MPAPIVPPPPLATQGLPWHTEVDDAVAAIGEARREHGDTFVVADDTPGGRDRYLFTFSPAGVEAFYALREEVASKGVADYLMLRRKLPDDVFDGRRTLPGALFRRDDVSSYLAHLEWALEVTVAELGGSGEVDVFAMTRRLGHRMGLASWAGRDAAEGEAFERLVAAFDALDGSEAFVHPDAMAAVAASGRAAESAALETVVDVLAPLPPDDGLPGRIHAAWADEPDPAVRRRGAALDVALVHVASMSNLHAALGWALVDLVSHADAVARVRAGGPEATAYAERCALESTRLAQRSIMARTVMAPISFCDGVTTYEVPPGWTIATLLPLLNTSAAPGLAAWDPDRWDRHRLRPVDGLASPQLVTAFGHGRHTCPAQPFSLTAMSTALRRLVGAYDLTPGWSTHPRPVAAQIGGVARAAAPVPLRYTAS